MIAIPAVLLAVAAAPLHLAELIAEVGEGAPSVEVAEADERGDPARPNERGRESEDDQLQGRPDAQHLRASGPDQADRAVGMNHVGLAPR